ncbi:MAG TPA: error-prone DNA polymerase, partial [Stellaceae bacterium]|nr:error-prone DNA polymerase [Stellaceae bacterium]
MSGYAELQVTSNFSFLRGASQPAELVLRAQELGHGAVAIADRNTLAGVVRAHAAAKEAGFRLVIGCRLDLTDAPSLLCFPTDRAAYGRLCRLLTRGKRRAEKGECHLAYADAVEHGEGQIMIALPPERMEEDFTRFLERVAADFGDRAYVAGQHLYRGDDAKRLHRLAALAARAGLPLVASNDVLYHVPERRPLQDVVTCIREGCTIAEAGFRLAANAERHLKSAAEMERLFCDHPGAVARSLEIVERCRFSLAELRYEYPDETGADGVPAQQKLERLAWEGAKRRYPAGVPEKIAQQIAHELDIIGTLRFASYFLTVHDIMSFAWSQGILCQGRGSAANSTVCYCLGVTDVDPAEVDLLFERFVSSERNEPPDIDVDFEHERREEVIQYIYRKYGRDRAGLTAVVSTYRSRGAMREVGKVLGLSEDVTSALAGMVWGWNSDTVSAQQVGEAGLDPADPTLRLALHLAHQLMGFPRHLSQHVGGFVITRGPLDELVPIENAAMADRTVIEWDKDDLNALEILKVDVLGLGMLSCIHRAFDLIERHYGMRYTIPTVPPDVAEVYEMLQHADTIGVFQVESRAQMSMLPRLKPATLFDLVIEVAIVRPGPIQGNMVHPYLRRRMGLEKDDYPPGLKEVLKRTLGVPLFQEQAMQIAMIGAGFTGGEADGLRRAMATFRRNGDIHVFEEKFIAGMRANGHGADFAKRCFDQIKGFSDYGFPLSHAASFALLVYVSAWIKCLHPDVFAAALLNSQPMGFYAPAQIVRDAAGHGVEVRPVDVNHSDWDCTLEPSEEKPVIASAAKQSPSDIAHMPAGDCRGALRVPRNDIGQCALRLGFREVKGLAEEEMKRLVESRGDRPVRSVAELRYRSGLSRAALETLAEADAFRSLGLDRRQALWAVRGLRAEEALPLFLPLAGSGVAEPAAALPEMSLGEHVAEDYRTVGFSLKQHPLALLRPALDRRRVLSHARLKVTPAKTLVTLAGLVLVRQQPGTASGVIFMTIEDETGIANLVVWRRVFERFRRIVMGAKLIQCEGRVQREGEVIHVVAERLTDLSPMLRRLWHPAERDRADLRLQS